MKAEEKAKELFLSLLTKEQRDEFGDKGYVTVIGGETKIPYLISPGYSGNIADTSKRRNRPSCECPDCQGRHPGYRTMCCHMGDMDVPYWAHMVAQLLHLKYNEAAFLRVAYVN